MFLDISQLKKVRRAWKNSTLQNDIFIQNFIQDTVQIGCTFIPERLSHEGYKDEQILEVFDYIVQTLKIKKIRIGFRLYEVDLVNENIGIYEDLITYCSQNDVEICANFGPIKCCGWPEIHFRDEFYEALKPFPKKRAVIDNTDQISEITRLQLQIFLQILNKKFTKIELNCIKILQPENESFNPFGVYQWTFTHSHIEKVIQILDTFLPGRQILLNSAGLLDANKIIDFITSRPDPKRYILGLDYYFTMPWIKAKILTRNLDLFLGSPFFKDMAVKKLKETAQKYGFSLEVTEAQIENYGSKATEVGNSLEAVKYVIQRSKEFLPNGVGTIRFWGIEQLVVKYINGASSNEQKQMIDFIKQST
jgi:hypothetical protein